MLLLLMESLLRVVLRDHNGSFISGINKRIEGVVSAFEAESYGVYGRWLLKLIRSLLCMH